MHLGRTLTRSAAVTALVAAPLLGPTGTASAAPTAFTTTYSLTHNGFCGGTIDASANPNGYPNSTVFTLTSNMFGVGACTVDATVNWRNLDSGVSGTAAQQISGPGFRIHALFVNPGAGRITATTTTNAAHIPGRADFTMN